MKTKPLLSTAELIDVKSRMWSHKIAMASGFVMAKTSILKQNILMHQYVVYYLPVGFLRINIDCICICPQLAFNSAS